MRAVVDYRIRGAFTVPTVWVYSARSASAPRPTTEDDGRNVRFDQSVLLKTALGRPNVSNELIVIPNQIHDPLLRAALDAPH